MKDFEISHSAAQRLLSMAETGVVSPPEGGLRISVRGGGCSGLSYHMEWCSGPQEGDQTYEKIGARVYVDRRSSLFLRGSELVYESGPMSSMFRIINPNAKSTCGCGESFSV